MTNSAHPAIMTRREVRRRDRREAILCVAGQSFLENGYAGTTMSGIAAALGGSKGTLWSHFPSKEELFSAVLEQATQAYRTQLSEILNPGEELIPTLRRVCVSLLTKITSPEAIALHRLVVAEVGRFPEMGRIFFDRAPRQSRMLVADFLAGAMDRGRLRKADPEMAARALMGLAVSGCHQLLLVGQIAAVTAEMIDADADFAADTFMRAYRPDDARGDEADVRPPLS